MAIRVNYIDSSQLDIKQWNFCLQQSGKPTLYAEPVFLHAMAPNWLGIVLNDYQAVMPVFPRKKWGISYLHQPAFIQKSGIFSPEALTKEEIFQLTSTVSKRFSFGEIYLDILPPFSFREKRNNFLIPLPASYEMAEANYKTDLLKNLRLAKRFDLCYQPEPDSGKIVQLFREAYGTRLSYRDADYRRFSGFLTSPIAPLHLVSRSVYKDRKMLAACLCIQDQHRLYLLMNYTSGQGRKMAANHFLLDQLVQEFIGKSSYLDLEGSDEPGIAHFYQNFGSINEPYYFTGWNRLPWPIRVAKPRY